jgi:3-oxoacyl-[acyl-carrier protein] reductase
MDLELKGKVAVITGASRGLGLATAQALAAEGCQVVLGARGLEGLTRAAEQISTGWRGPKVVPVTADVSTPDGVDHLIETAVVECGGIDILVNNVGIGRGGTLEQTTDADWREAFDNTLFPAIRCSQLAVPHMRQRGGGVIVIISSIYGREAGGRMTYNVVKAAEISFTKSLAQQLARDEIRRRCRAWFDPVRGRIVVEATAGGSEGNRGVHPARAAVRPFRHGPGNRQPGCVPLVAEGELGERHHRCCRRLPVQDVLGAVCGSR